MKTLGRKEGRRQTASTWRWKIDHDLFPLIKWVCFFVTRIQMTEINLKNKGADFLFWKQTWHSLTSSYHISLIGHSKLNCTCNINYRNKPSIRTLLTRVPPLPRQPHIRLATTPTSERNPSLWGYCRWWMRLRWSLTSHVANNAPFFSLQICRLMC